MEHGYFAKCIAFYGMGNSKKAFVKKQLHKYLVVFFREVRRTSVAFLNIMK